MRISDWSSDVCSSDLIGRRALGRKHETGIGTSWPQGHIREAGAEGTCGGVGRRSLGGGCRSAQSRRGAGGVDNQRRFFDYGASGEGTSNVAPSIARKRRGSRIATRKIVVTGTSVS